MSILCWNARGLGDIRALNRLRMAIRDYTPSLVFISETKLRGSKPSSLKHQLGFCNGFVVDSVGRSGGLALLWSNLWDVTLQSFSAGHIDTLIESAEGWKWHLTGFYGHPEYNQRHHSWNLLRRLSSLHKFPWLVLGDFNEIVTLSEKVGGNDRYDSQMSSFLDTLEYCGLRDLGYFGSPFTWNNRRSPPNLIQARLDRAVASSAWLEFFSGAKVRHLDYFGSDHRMLKIELEHDIVVVPQIRIKPFRFEPLFRTCSDYGEIVKDLWIHSGSSSLQNSHDLHMVLSEWGRRYNLGVISHMVIFHDKYQIFSTKFRHYIIK